jgi:general stress protein YciG
MTPTNTPDTTVTSTINTTPKKARRGFAAMSPEKQREIASKGGKAAHVKGTAHEFTPEKAREAGRKGGLSRRRPTVVTSDAAAE